MVTPGAKPTRVRERGASPSFRGLMTWSINWVRYYNWEFENSHAPYLAALP
ncbi:MULTISPECIES: hypothetical protein [Kribbella]|uniref:hypothetical protein n=1 Tax=Kribbella TaxID=182639 RepID=UPI00130547FD|nr:MULTISPECIES: hypothetical protein [Kribbella]